MNLVTAIFLICSQEDPAKCNQINLKIEKSACTANNRNGYDAVYQSENVKVKIVCR